MITIDPTSRTLTGTVVALNSTVFNLNDTVTVSGYLQSVTVQYNPSRLPSVSARIWIYGIVAIPGSYIGCSQYLIPSGQVSTSQTVQTYNLPANTINLFNGTYVAVGIQDTSASLAATWGGAGLRIGGANLSVGSQLYFTLDNSQVGAKISYTIVF